MDKGELQFVSWLASVNTSLGRYIARLMDEAAGHSTTTYVVPLADVETDLGEELMKLGRALTAKGAGRPSRIAGAATRDLAPGRTEAGEGA
jgi:hypothetical protein